MAFRLFPSKAKPAPETKKEEPVSYAPENVLFSVFGISMDIPGNWLIYPQRSREDLTYESGCYKFEENRNRTTSISVGVRWETEDTTAEEFIENYIKGMEAQYKKKQKKNIEFSVVEKEILTLENGYKACIIQCEYKASAGLFMSTSKVSRVRVLNLAYYDEKTHRAIIGTIVAKPDKMEENIDYYKSLLTNIKSA